MSIINTRFMFAGVISALVMMTAVHDPMYARAQITSTTVTEVPIESITPIDAGTITTAPTSTSSFGSMTVQCWRSTTLAGSAARIQIPTSRVSLYTDVVCWEVYSLNGGIASVPITSEPAFEPTDIPTVSSSNSVTASAASSSSNDDLAKILPGALIGSLFGLVLLIFTTIYLVRLRNRRRAAQDSRARRWVHRNSAAVRESWAMKETPGGFNGASKPETA